VACQRLPEEEQRFLDGKVSGSGSQLHYSRVLISDGLFEPEHAAQVPRPLQSPKRPGRGPGRSEVLSSASMSARRPPHCLRHQLLDRSPDASAASGSGLTPIPAGCGRMPLSRAPRRTRQAWALARTRLQERELHRQTSTADHRIGVWLSIGAAAELDGLEWVTGSLLRIGSGRLRRHQRTGGNHGVAAGPVVHDRRPEKLPEEVLGISHAAVSLPPLGANGINQRIGCEGVAPAEGTWMAVLSWIRPAKAVPAGHRDRPRSLHEHENIGGQAMTDM